MQQKKKMSLEVTSNTSVWLTPVPDTDGSLLTRRPTLITHNHLHCQIIPSALEHLLVLISACIENIYTFSWFWEEIVTQNGKAAKCIQDARLTEKMGRCSAGESEVKVWVQRWNVSGFKEKNVFQFGLHSKMKYPRCLSSDFITKFI